MIGRFRLHDWQANDLGLKLVGRFSFFPAWYFNLDIVHNWSFSSECNQIIRRIQIFSPRFPYTRYTFRKQHLPFWWFWGARNFLVSRDDLLFVRQAWCCVRYDTFILDATTMWRVWWTSWHINRLDSTFFKARSAFSKAMSVSESVTLLLFVWENLTSVSER